MAHEPLSIFALATAAKGHLSVQNVVQAVAVAVATALLTAYSTVKVVEVQLGDVMRRLSIIEERMSIQGDRLSRMEGENAARNGSPHGGKLR